MGQACCSDPEIPVKAPVRLWRLALRVDPHLQRSSFRQISANTSNILQILTTLTTFAKCWPNVWQHVGNILARSPLHRHRFLQESSQYFFEIYKII